MLLGDLGAPTSVASQAAMRTWSVSAARVAMTTNNNLPHDITLVSFLGFALFHQSLFKFCTRTGFVCSFFSTMTVIKVVFGITTVRQRSAAHNHRAIFSETQLSSFVFSLHLCVAAHAICLQPACNPLAIRLQSAAPSLFFDPTCYRCVPYVSPVCALDNTARHCARHCASGMVVQSDAYSQLPST